RGPRPPEDGGRRVAGAVPGGDRQEVHGWQPGATAQRSRDALTRTTDREQRVSSPVTESPAERAAGPRSSKGARTRARLLAAAKEIFEENGFLEARISDIAERAKLSHGSFYTYFDSKEQIFREVAAAVDD